MTTAPLMKREKVEHILRAAGAATGLSKFVLIGSAAVVAWRDVVPNELAMSRDIDLFAFDRPDADDIADQLDGALGQASTFDQSFGYYCDGVGPETAVLPENWQSRAKEFGSPNTNGVVALVPHPDDIALSKAVAWRPKDVDWLRAAAAHLVIDPNNMLVRLDQMPASCDRRLIAERIGSIRRP